MTIYTRNIFVREALPNTISYTTFFNQNLSLKKPIRKSEGNSCSPDLLDYHNGRRGHIRYFPRPVAVF